MPDLLPLIVVHCFWAPRCSTTVSDVTPEGAHARMEEHYAAEHEHDLQRIVGGLR